MLFVFVLVPIHLLFFIFFFFNDTATTEIYTLSLHDALPISPPARRRGNPAAAGQPPGRGRDRKSTRLNSSHDQISYAVFCLKKKKKIHTLAIKLQKNTKTTTHHKHNPTQ